MRKPSGKGFVQAGALLTRRVRTASEKRGFAETRLLTQWENICGPEIAGIARPLRVSYSRDGFGATLLVTCDGARAPEVQMQADTIRQKVNACYGYNAISRVRITQTDSTGFAEAQARYRTQRPVAGPPPPDPAESAPPEEVRAVGDPELRAALSALGQNIRSRSGADETGER